MSLKVRLHNTCLQVLNDRVKSLEEELAQLRKSQAGETKSSMGDKYETAREMINLEKAKLSERLTENVRMRNLLNTLRPEKKMSAVQSGALLKVGDARYYISVGLGKVIVDGITIFVISPVSPIGQAMLDKKLGETFWFNGRTQVIDEIE